MKGWHWLEQDLGADGYAWLLQALEVELAAILSVIS